MNQGTDRRCFPFVGFINNSLTDLFTYNPLEGGLVHGYFTSVSQHRDLLESITLLSSPILDLLFEEIRVLK